MILADRQKEEMDEELRAALKGFTLEWHTRTGFPHSISDLQKVAAGQAKNVILLNPDSEEVHLCMTFARLLKSRYMCRHHPAMRPGERRPLQTGSGRILLSVFANVPIWTLCHDKIKT